MTSNTQEIGQEGGQQGATTEMTGSGLDENVAGALSYLLGIVTGVVFYAIDDRAFVRFHAAQSIVLSALLFASYAVLSVLQIVLTGVMFSGSSGGFIIGSILSLVFGLIWLVLALGGFALWAYLLVRSYQGQTPRIPVVAGIADSIA